MKIRRITYPFTAFIVGIFILSYLNTGWAEESILITPRPQQFMSKDFNVTIGTDWRIIVGANSKGNDFSARYLKQEFLNDYNLIIPMEKIATAQEKKRVILGTVSEVLIKDTYKKLNLDIPEITGKEGYALEVFNDYIVLVGNEPNGVFYAVQTLLQLAKPEGDRITIQAVKILDHPNVKNRVVHFCGANLDKMKDYLDQMSKLKFNMAIIENWGYFKLDEGDNRQKLEEIFTYARDRYIEPVPELVSFSHAGPILTEDSRCGEGTLVKDAHFKFINNLAIPTLPVISPLVNIIRSEETNIVITNLEKTKIYRENTDYKIINGPCTYPYPITNTPTQIIRIPQGSIEENEEVLISYDYIINRSTDWAAWSVPYCPSSSRTYEIMTAALQNTIEALSPNLISLAHDEIIGMNRDSRCRKRNLTNAQLLADDINKLYAIIKEQNPDIKLLLWDDMFNPWHNGGNEKYQVPFGGISGKTAGALDLIPKDIIIMLWWYEANDKLGKIEKSPAYFESEGFDYLVTAWKEKITILNWSNVAKSRNGCIGTIVTAWDGWGKNIEGIRYAAEIAWH